VNYFMGSAIRTEWLPTETFHIRGDLGKASSSNRSNISASLPIHRRSTAPKSNPASKISTPGKSSSSSKVVSARD
jgi:hypothetical protein